MCAMDGRTRSWLMVSRVPTTHEVNETQRATGAQDANGSSGTRLYFGSAVVPVMNKSTGKSGMGIVFKALLGFHKLYSRLLLSAAAKCLERRSR